MSPEIAEESTDQDDVLIIEFRLDEQVFGLPVTQVLEVQKIQKPTSVYRTPDFVVGVMNLRGDVVALLDLARLFDLNGIEDLEDRNAILVQHDEQHAGVVVEEIIGTRRIDLKNLETAPESVEGVSDQWIQGVQQHEGRMTVLLDGQAIFESEQVQEL
jgi:purine-binding chemotaxis protein CheW